MSNTEIWDKLAKTDPAHTKKFVRGGGFKGTAIKPIYTERKMTEVFGPAGIGWGMGEPAFDVVPGSDGQVAVFCRVALWIREPGSSGPTDPWMVWGVGGDMVVVKQSSGLRTDDEAFKKAFTDAVGNAMKHLGMSADVHMGLFDDNKYVESVADELQHGVLPSGVERMSADRAKKILNFESMLREIDSAETLKVLDNWAAFYLGADAWLPGGWANRLLDRIDERRAQIEAGPDRSAGPSDPNEVMDQQYAETLRS